MEYNTQRNRLIIPEYGRNLQKMVDSCVEIPDREKRTRTAEAIVNIMAQMNPRVKESLDYRQKLWDHIHIISGFKLDVDSPFPPPSREVLKSRPRPLKYDKREIKFRHFGKNIQDIIDKASTYPDGPEKDTLIRYIANYMKKSYLNWNKASVDDDLIFKEMEILSHHRLKAGNDLKLQHTNDILARNVPVKKKRFMRPGQQGNGYQNHNFKSRR